MLPRSSFDEVHFGKFAAYYIQREYYFDVHPPLAKLLFGLAGWFVGFDGKFKFENIGDSYSANHVPYVGMRALPAIMGSLTIPVVYAIMKEVGYSTVVAAFSASLILFGQSLRASKYSILTTSADNAHVSQTRLILLDSALIFFLSLTMYAYVRFKKLRHRYGSSPVSITSSVAQHQQRVHHRLVDVAWLDWLLHGLCLGL